MKIICIIICILLTKISFCQTPVTTEMLRTKNGVAYYQGVPYTGNAIGRTIMPYKNGLLQGQVGDSYYNKGIIEDFKAYTKTNKVLVHFKNENSLKPIVYIDFGIWFEGQVGDTVYYDTNILSIDSTSLKFGLILWMNNNNKEFVELNDLTLLSYWWWWKYGSDHSEKFIKGNKICNSVLKFNAPKNKFYEFKVKLSSNEIMNLGGAQKVFFKPK